MTKVPSLAVLSVGFLLACGNPAVATSVKSSESSESSKSSLTKSQSAKTLKALLSVRPPVAKKIQHIHTTLGDQRLDPYFWLRERDHKDVLGYLKSENTYFEKIFRTARPIEKNIFQEMKSRVKLDEEGYPYPFRDYEYYFKFTKTGQYPTFFRRSLKDKAESVIVDQNQEAKGKVYFDLRGLSVSPSQQLVLYSTDEVGRRFYDISFKDLSTHRPKNWKIKATTGNAVWGRDESEVYFSRQNPDTLRSDRIFKYNTQTGQEELVFEEKDDTYSISISKSLTLDKLFITSESTLATEIRMLDLNDAKATWQVFFPRQREHEYAVFDGGDRFYIRTNWQAKNFRVMEVTYDPKRSLAEQSARWHNQKNWTEVIPTREDALIDDLLALKSHVILSGKLAGLSSLEIFDRQTRQREFIKFTDPVYDCGLGPNRNYDSTEVRYEYESLNRPPSVFDFDLKSKKSHLRHTEDTPNFDENKYESHRVIVTARDGAKVPVSLLTLKGQRPTGASPILIFGYGSYGYAMTPTFSTPRLSLVDRGWVYAIAHVRGGSEMGRSWYEDGRQMKKKNTFNDFIDVTESLIQQGWAHPKKVFAEGGSAGGLLMGAILNLRPDLYKGVIAEVPFVDVLTTMLDSSLPLTTGEYDEWGNPNQKEAYNYIKSYSPYDNVTSKTYPHLLITTGYYDSQVQYWEPAKWLAKLRTNNQGPSLQLMHTEMNAGHSGLSGRFDSLKESARQYAFLLWVNDL